MLGGGVHDVGACVRVNKQTCVVKCSSDSRSPQGPMHKRLVAWPSVHSLHLPGQQQNYINFRSSENVSKPTLITDRGVSSR